MAQPPFTQDPNFLPLHNLAMSRNIRLKIPSTPVKVAKRRLSDSSDSSSLNLSDDDGYSAVEDVSESEDDDEEHVLAAEEDHIATNASRKRAPPRPVDESDDADEEDGDEEDEDDDDAEHDAEDDDAPDEHESWDGILSDPDDDVVEQPASYILDQNTTDVEKHVRFTGVPDSDSESTTTEASEDDMHDFFPDIFVAQNNLDPAFRKEIENDDNSSNSGSFWDFHSGSQDFYEVDSDNERIVHDSEETTPTVTPMASAAPTEVSTPVAILQDFDDSDDLDDVDELDGYECEFAGLMNWAEAVLIYSRQPMVKPQRRISRSRLFVANRFGAPKRSISLPTPILRGQLHPVQASLILGGSNWTLTRSLSRFSTL